MLERAPTLPATHAAALAAWVQERRALFAWWAASRAVVLAGSIALHVLRRPHGYFGRTIFGHALGPLEAWDGIWYRRIAQRGYLLVPGHQSDPAFFPLFSLLLKVAHGLGMPLAAAGLVLANGFFLAALFAFDTFGHAFLPGSTARRATALLAVFPTSYVCSMVYPESLVLLALALAGVFAVRGQWIACAAAAAVAALARPEGVLLVLPIAGVACSRWRGLAAEQRGRALAALFAAPAAAVSFPLYLGYALHDPLAWAKAQHAWGRSFQFGGLWHAVGHFDRIAAEHPWAWRDASFCVVTLLLLAVAWRIGAPRLWIALGALLVLLPLGSGSFESDARFGLLALPAYWGLAWLCRPRWAFGACALLSTALLAAATITLPLVFP